MVKRTIQGILARSGYTLKPIGRGIGGPLQLWDEDEPFQVLFRDIEPLTVAGKQRCFMIYQFLKHVRSIDGDCIEIGVYRGGTAKLIAMGVAGQPKWVHLFDTFSGLPPGDKEKDPYYYAHKAAFADTSLQSVQEHFHGLPNVCFYAGYFPDTAGPVKEKRFCLAHVDVDLYQSVIDACNFIYPRMAHGGIIVFDDYGDRSCEGAKNAVDKFFQDRDESPCYLPTGQCIIIKQ